MNSNANIGGMYMLRLPLFLDMKEYKREGAKTGKVIKLGDQKVREVEKGITNGVVNNPWPPPREEVEEWCE